MDKEYILAYCSPHGTQKLNSNRKLDLEGIVSSQNKTQTMLNNKRKVCRALAVQGSYQLRDEHTVAFH